MDLQIIFIQIIVVFLSALSRIHSNNPQNSSSSFLQIDTHPVSTEVALSDAPASVQFKRTRKSQVLDPSQRQQRKIHYILKTIESGRDSTAIWQLNQLLFETMDDEQLTVLMLNEASRLFTSNDPTLLKIFQLVISNVNIDPLDVFLLLLNSQYKPQSISRLKETVLELTKHVLQSNSTVIISRKPESGIKVIKKVFEYIFSAIKPHDPEWLRLDQWLSRDFLESVIKSPESYLIAINSLEYEMKNELLSPNQWFYVQELYHSCLQGSTVEDLKSDWEESLLANPALATSSTANESCNGVFGRRFILNSHTRQILSAKSENSKTDGPTIIQNYIEAISDRRVDYIDVKIRDDILLAHLTQVVFSEVDRGHFSCNQSKISLELLNFLGRNRGIRLPKYSCILERSRGLVFGQYERSRRFGQTLTFIRSYLPSSLEQLGLKNLLDLCGRTLPQDVFLLGCYLYQNNMTNGDLWGLLPEQVQGQVFVLLSEQILKWVVRVDEDYYEIVPRSFELVKIAFLRDVPTGEPRLWLFMPYVVTGEYFQVGIYSLEKEDVVEEEAEEKEEDQLKQHGPTRTTTTTTTTTTLRKIYESYSYIRGNRFPSFMSSSTFRLTMLDNMETFYLLREDIPFCLHRDTSTGVPLSLNLCIGDYAETGERAEFFVCPDENDWTGVLEELKAKYVG